MTTRGRAFAGGPHRRGSRSRARARGGAAIRRRAALPFQSPRCGRAAVDPGPPRPRAGPSRLRGRERAGASRPASATTSTTITSRKCSARSRASMPSRASAIPARPLDLLAAFELTAAKRWRAPAARRAGARTRLPRAARAAAPAAGRIVVEAGRGGARARGPTCAEARWVLERSRRTRATSALSASCCLNLVELAPGEALYQEAGILHALPGGRRHRADGQLRQRAPGRAHAQARGR